MKRQATYEGGSVERVQDEGKRREQVSVRQVADIEI